MKGGGGGKGRREGAGTRAGREGEEQGEKEGVVATVIGDTTSALRATRLECEVHGEVTSFRFV